MYKDVENSSFELALQPTVDACRTITVIPLCYITIPSKNQPFFSQQVAKLTQLRAILWLQPWNYSSAPLLRPANTKHCCAVSSLCVFVLLKRSVWDLSVICQFQCDYRSLRVHIAQQWLQLLIVMQRLSPLSFILIILSLFVVHMTWHSGKK